MSNGVATFQTGLSVCVSVSNFGSTLIHIPKYMRIVFASLIKLETVRGVDGDDASAYSPSLRKGEKELGIGGAVNWKGDIAVDEKFCQHRPALFHTFAPVFHMSDGHLSHVKATEHRIQLTPEATSMFQPSYRTGLTQRAKERQEASKMLKLSIIEPANAEWASAVLLIPRNDGWLRFCFSYRRLSNLLRRR